MIDDVARLSLDNKLRPRGKYTNIFRKLGLRGQQPSTFMNVVDYAFPRSLPPCRDRFILLESIRIPKLR